MDREPTFMEFIREISLGWQDPKFRKDFLSAFLPAFLKNFALTFLVTFVLVLLFTRMLP